MKLTPKIGLVAAVASLVFVAGYAKGQNQSEKLTAGEFERIESKVDLTPNATTYADLGRAYEMAPNSDEVVKGIVVSSFVDKNRDKSDQTRLLALQVMQNQKLLKQNERIIQLLEQQQKAK